MARNHLNALVTTTLPRAVLYIRRSDLRQEGNHSLDIQERILRQQCAERYNVIVVEIFTDDKQSAYRKSAKQRPKMLELMSYVLEQDVDVVIFYDESRVSRRITDFVNEIWEEIIHEKPHVKFYCATDSGDEAWDPHSPITQLRLTMAAEESMTKSRRSVDAQKHMLVQDRRPGSSVPYGLANYVRDENKLIPSEDAPIVYFTFHLASWGYSISKIADFLNSCGVPSPKGGVWRASTVDNILNNQIYLGNLSWNVRTSRTNSARKPLDQITLVQDVYDPVIPNWLWVLAHQAIDQKSASGKSLSTPYLLSGLAVCEKCRTILLNKDETPGKSKKKYMYYVCPTCSNKIDVDVLHEVVIKRMQQDFGIRTQIMSKKASNVLSSWSKDLQKEIDQMDSDLKVIEINQSLGPHSTEMSRAMVIGKASLEKRTQRFKNLKFKVDSIKGAPNEDVEAYLDVDVLGTLTPVELRTFFRHAISKVGVNFGAIRHVSIECRLSPLLSIEDQ